MFIKPKALYISFLDRVATSCCTQRFRTALAIDRSQDGGELLVEELSVFRFALLRNDRTKKTWWPTSHGGTAADGFQNGKSENEMV
jgi:hypothetical protein